MKCILNFVCLVLLTSCDSLNSSFDKNNSSGEGQGTRPPVTQKPAVCQFDFAKTCWAESATQITSCLDKDETEETFSQNKEVCTNSNQKLVIFSNPSEMFNIPFDVNATPIDFRIFPDSINECLRVTGHAQKFKVSLSASKKYMSFDFTGDRMEFTCLDGQTVQVPYEVFEGCAQALGDKFVSTVPGLQMQISQKGSRSRWSFRLRGAINTPDLFHCSEP